MSPLIYVSVNMMAAGCQKRGGVEGGAAGEADERTSACMHHFGLKRVQDAEIRHTNLDD